MKYTDMTSEILAHVHQNIQGATRLDGDCLVYVGKISDRPPILGLSWQGKKFYVNIRRFLWKEDGRYLTSAQVISPTCGDPRCVALEHMKSESRVSQFRRFGKTMTVRRMIALRVSNARRQKLTPEMKAEVIAWDGPSKLGWEHFGISRTLFFKTRRDAQIQAFGGMVAALRRAA